MKLISKITISLIALAAAGCLEAEEATLETECQKPEISIKQDLEELKADGEDEAYQELLEIYREQQKEYRECRISEVMNDPNAQGYIDNGEEIIPQIKENSDENEKTQEETREKTEDKEALQTEGQKKPEETEETEVRPVMPDMLSEELEPEWGTSQEIVE